MKKLSILSTTLLVLGLSLYGVNWIIDGYSELAALFGFISFLIGIVLSFIAIAKREIGALKYISLISFFVVMFLITWFEPLEILRIFTWLKNIS
ncbi:hypothetical protein [Neobacillus sp. YIM B06451]|uniref:hypothetical protein n=1 Tax=Neobacillus sp. YIM B06451 TaxID=3070994 RepID=UPI00292F96F3|nr:hypothetical protein [Neobacillus sp. YIM B06451]